MADVGKCFQLNKKFKLEMYISNKTVPKTLKLLNTFFLKLEICSVSLREQRMSSKM